MFTERGNLILEQGKTIATIPGNFSRRRFLAIPELIELLRNLNAFLKTPQIGVVDLEAAVDKVPGSREKIKAYSERAIELQNATLNLIGTLKTRYPPSEGRVRDGDDRGDGVGATFVEAKYQRAFQRIPDAISLLNQTRRILSKDMPGLEELGLIAYKTDGIVGEYVTPERENELKDEIRRYNAERKSVADQIAGFLKIK